MSKSSGNPAQKTVELARAIRADALRMVYAAQASHIGSCLSAADLLAVLYGHSMRHKPDQPAWPERDRLVLSKGHAAAALYAALANLGYFPVSELTTLSRNGSRLLGHASHHVPGVEFSTGALGHGLSLGAGIALAARMDSALFRSFVILSDGECDEGSTWEAALFAGHHALSNLVALVDYNKIQSFGRTADVLDLEPLADKWRAFGWHVTELDGHDHGQLIEALALSCGKPHLLLCHTVKGKGVSFMEDRLEWHYRSPSHEQLAAALSEVAG